MKPKERWVRFWLGDLTISDVKVDEAADLDKVGFGLIYDTNNIGTGSIAVTMSEDERGVVNEVKIHLWDSGWKVIERVDVQALVTLERLGGELHERKIR